MTGTIVVVTCSGVFSTGKLTAQVGTMLLQRSPGRFEACIPATRLTPSLKSALRQADRILVLDGDRCGSRKVRALGIEPHLQIIATEHGIQKVGTAVPRFEEIECLSRAVSEAVRW